METVTQHHIHMYFSDETEAIAQNIYSSLRQHPDVLSLGRFHSKPVGPHPVRQFQVMVKPEKFEGFVAWLQEARRGLDVFIHPLMTDDHVAHTAMARWLGTPHTLLLDRL